MVVWGGVSEEGRTDLCRLENRRLTAIRHREEIIEPIVRPFAGAVGPGFFLMHNNASSASCQMEGAQTGFVRGERMQAAAGG